jgi:hypothetical protein
MNRLISRIAVMFGPPDFSSDPQAYMQELARLTASYTGAELDKAADLVIRAHKPTHLKPWPTPAEICTACADAREMMTPAPKFDPGAKVNRDWTGESRQNADALLNSENGRAAADEGWSLSLWDFYRKHKRQPNAPEIVKIKRDAREFDAAYSEACGLRTSTGQMLVQLGDGMLRKRGETAGIAHGVIPEGRP